MCTVLPFDASVDKPQITLVHETRGLQRIVTAFTAHIGTRQLAEFRIHERRQFSQRRIVAVAPGLQQSGYPIRRESRHAFIVCTILHRSRGLLHLKHAGSTRSSPDGQLERQSSSSPLTPLVVVAYSFESREVFAL